MNESFELALGLVVVAMAVLLGWMRAAAKDTPTPVERPTLLPANAPLVAVLRTVATDIEASAQRCADGLRDIARVIQISATEPVEERLRDRVGGIVDDHAAVIRQGGQRIRGGN